MHAGRGGVSKMKTPPPRHLTRLAAVCIALCFTNYFGMLLARPVRVLPNGGPSRLFTGNWTAASQTFQHPAEDPREPIPGVVDWVVVGCGAGERAFDLASVAASGAFERLLSRTRLAAVLCLAASRSADVVVELEPLLWRRAPAWRIVRVDSTSSTVAVLLERRVRAFVFGITGGTDGRAAYVERTWGRRTPVQWYADRWDSHLRPIVDEHPMYAKNPWGLMTYKITRIWQRDGGRVERGRPANSETPASFAAHFREGYDWYVRLWDDNYFHEENLHGALGHLDPSKPVTAGKAGWYSLSTTAKVPFSGGGAGWFLSTTAMDRFGLSIDAAEAWMPVFRAQPIRLTHDLHNEDIILSVWLDKIKVSFINILGVEHVSPGLGPKQRCMSNETLYSLRWDRNASVYYETDLTFLLENTTYGYTKPLVWHYMSPNRLVRLETLLYPDAGAQFAGETLPQTNAELANPKKKCYPGVPPGPALPRSGGVFETPLADPAIVTEWKSGCVLTRFCDGRHAARAFQHTSTVRSLAARPAASAVLCRVVV
ncbi:hypothetical protein DIPPA_13057 [Diplonema papillatum]|nr:hypothetical protein DIPPA_13057 [Diplonema papillatum]